MLTHLHGGEDEYEIIRSRSTSPEFYHAPWPGTPNYVPSDYQHAGVEYRIARDNGIIGDAPGVGKTAQAVLTSNAMEAKATLVTAPASFLLNWEREIWRWSTRPNVSTYVVRKASDGVNLNADYVIVSYDLQRNPAILDALMSRMWDHHVVDECHYAKDPDGNKRTRPLLAADLLPSVTGAATWMSGTLMPNQPIEAYNAIRRLNWDAIDRASLNSFREFYYDKGEGFVRKQVYNKVSGKFESKVQRSTDIRNVPRNLDDLQYRLRKHLMVRRLKEDVLKQLPPKRWTFFPIDPNGATRRALAHPGWAEVERLYEADPDDFERHIPVDGAVSTARLELGKAKAPGVIAYIEELLNSGRHKVLVSAWHHEVLDMMYDALKKYGLVYMDGGTPLSKKQAFQDEFQENFDIRIGLGQMLPLGENWTLTAAQDAVAAEPWYAPGKNDQFLDRLHRRGQRGSVEGHVPVVPGTLDERILATAIDKSQNIHLAMDEKLGGS